MASQPNALAVFLAPKNQMLEQLIHRIKIRQAELHLSLANGIPASWDAYQRMVGEYQGLQLALDMVDNMLDEEKNQE